MIKKHPPTKKSLSLTKRLPKAVFLGALWGLIGLFGGPKKIENFFQKLFQNPLTNEKECAIILPVEINGASPSGKATDSDSVIS